MNTKGSTKLSTEEHPKWVSWKRGGKVYRAELHESFMEGLNLIAARRGQSQRRTISRLIGNEDLSGRKRADVARNAIMRGMVNELRSMEAEPPCDAFQVQLDMPNTYDGLGGITEMDPDYQVPDSWKKPLLMMVIAFCGLAGLAGWAHNFIG